ncbi:MAG TPA: T9SS type A sorting domain-containing protein, partial [candidate division Zixibacteria bacterium]|nr:T9SS type A sorting domain-containing protein [candidate division Zixibacteria bacterium]
ETQPIFDWWQWFETDSGRDGGVVEISTDDGATWSVAHPEGGYPCPALAPGSALAGKPAFSGASDGWEYQSIDLSPFTTHGEVWLRFYFAADGTNHSPGWYIDDIGLHEAFGVVKGRVNLDYRVNNAGAKIEVPEQGIFAYSDSAGNFFIDSVKAGSWNLVCERDSFVTQTHGPFSIARNETLVVDFLMPPILMSTNFDTNSAGGVAEPPHGWQWGRPDSLAAPPYGANSDSLCWGTNLAGNYVNNADWKLDFVVFLAANNPHMQVYQWYKLAGEYAGFFWDGANVKVANYYDTVWTVVPAVHKGYDGYVSSHNEIMGGEPCFGGMGYGDSWHREIFDLSMHAMDTVVIRFHLGADGAGTARGWYIDDLVILDYETPGIGQDAVIWKPDNIQMTAYPNPFNAAVSIEFILPTEGVTTIDIIDMTGRLVNRLIDGEYLAGGVHSRRWNGTDFSGAVAPTGIYLAKITSGKATASRTLLLIK